MDELMGNDSVPVDVAAVNAFAAHEVTFGVVDDLVRLDVGMTVRGGYWGEHAL